MSFEGLAAALLLSASVLGLAYLVLAIAWVQLWARRRSPPAPATLPRVTVLKPLHGAEPGLFDSLSSFCSQAYGAEFQLIFGVQHPRDPAIDVVGRLREAYPGLPIELVIDNRMHGSNRKVSNLINMEAFIRHEVVVLADSDMTVAPDYLARVVSELGRPGVGGVTCLYHGTPAASRWSHLAALSVDTHFLPSVVLGLSLKLAQPCFGSTIALRRSTLERLGGFRAVVDDLADDYLLGQAIRRLGLSVVLPAFTVGHSCPERSLRDLLGQELRWVRTIRHIDAAGHAGSLLMHPLPLALLAMVVELSVASALAAGAAILLRIGLCLAVERSFGLKAHSYWLVPARDLLSFAVYLASFGGRAVSWRGHRYDVTPEGVLMPKDEALNPR